MYTPDMLYEYTIKDYRSRPKIRSGEFFFLKEPHIKVYNSKIGIAGPMFIPESQFDSSCMRKDSYRD